MAKRTVVHRQTDPANAQASRPFGRSLADFGDLMTAEEKLLACCRQGERAIIGEACPEARSEENCVRATFVRFLALGGDADAPVDERGVQLRGAWLDGPLNLEGAIVSVGLLLWECHIEAIHASYARFKYLNLTGSHVTGKLQGDGIRCEGSIVLRFGFHAEGQVRLLGANIGGNLECDGSRFDHEGVALHCDGAVVTGDVFLRHGFRARGVRLVGVSIGGDLDFTRASFDFLNDSALACGACQIKGRLVVRALSVRGHVELDSASVGGLWDDAESWDDVEGYIDLDGFTYAKLIATAPTDRRRRITWLERQAPRALGEEFRPQPWEQLIKVLREMGHLEEARAVAVEKQVRLRRSGRMSRGGRVFHWVYGALVGYGYRPLRLVAVTTAVWLFWAAFYWAATNPAPGSTHLLAPPPREGNVAPADYSNFIPLIYSADVLLPVVDLGYKKEWQPVVSKSGKPLRNGQLLRFLYWFEIAFGWVAGLLLVGVLGNLIKKD